MYPVRFTQTAQAELIDAQDRFEGEAPGLGHRFREAVDGAIEERETRPSYRSIPRKRASNHGQMVKSWVVAQRLAIEL